jgi:hypothetical protein
MEIVEVLARGKGLKGSESLVRLSQGRIVYSSYMLSTN